MRVKVDNKEVKETLKKVKRLRKLLKEVNSLEDELVSKEIKIFISMKDKGQATEADYIRQFLHEELSRQKETGKIV